MIWESGYFDIAVGGIILPKGAGGRCAGAGVPGHIHAHIVPRWNGDINFMTILADVRVIPQAIDEAYAQLKTAIASLSKTEPA